MPWGKTANDVELQMLVVLVFSKLDVSEAQRPAHAWTANRQRVQLPFSLSLITRSGLGLFHLIKLVRHLATPTQPLLESQGHKRLGLQRCALLHSVFH
jgi:hypothetical protein